MKIRTLIAVAALVPLAGTALANEGSDKSSKAGASFDALDTNRDGRISRAEAAADSTIMWSSADANGDGYLDTGEFKKAMKSKSGETPTPQPQSEPMPNDASGQPSDTVPPGEAPSTTPPTDTETPRQ
jgi:Ca2+-binding EF-hand superfamily protein